MKMYAVAVYIFFAQNFQLIRMMFINLNLLKKFEIEDIKTLIKLIRIMLKKWLKFSCFVPAH